MRCLAVIASSILFSISAVAQTAQHVVISEVQIAGTSTQDEFVELYNPTSAPVNLADWRLARKTSSGTESNLLTSFPAVSIPARGFLLIASAEYDTMAHEMILPDVLYSTSQRLATDNTVILYSDAGVSVVDKVAMGAATDREGIAAPNPVTNGSIERKARSSSAPSTLVDGGIDAFAGNGFDTDNNANDFVAQNDSQPQNSLSEVEGLIVRNTTTDAFFGSIQLGIDRAGAGQTLEVAEGIFSEELNIGKDLTLRGVQASADARSRVGGESVVQKITIDSAAIDVTIDGFKLDIGTRATLIHSDAVGSTTIINTIVNGGYAFGDFSNPIILINRGATAVFWRNRVTDVSGPDSTLSTIGFGPLTTTLTFQENDVVGGPLAISDLAGADVVVQNNRFTNSFSEGMIVSNASVRDVSIIGNTFLGNARTGLRLNSSNLTVTGKFEVDRNTFSNSPIGLKLISPVGVTVSRNTIENNEIGIELEGNATSIAVHSNTIANNLTWNLNNLSTDIVDARYNWWGSSVETDIVSTISGSANYDPWTGKPEQQAVTTANPLVEFRSAGLTMSFASLPPNTSASTVTVVRSPTKPQGIPDPPINAGTVAPLYLEISATGLTNYTFHVDVTLDVSTASNFSSTTTVMYFSPETGQWVAYPARYDSLTETVVFAINHFTTFAFVNPSNPLDVFVTNDPVDANEEHTVAYPKVGMSTGATFAADDWAYTAPTLSLYVAPNPGGEPLKAAEFFVGWDASGASLTFENGNLFGADGTEGLYQDTLVSAGLVKINTASLINENVTPSIGTYLAKLNFTIIQPGYNAIVLSGTDFRSYDAVADSQQSVFVTTHPGAVKFYLGDFAASADTLTTGDGRVDFDDLVPFSLAYFSKSAESPSPYKAKFDIGPTNGGGGYLAMPTPDGEIGFEDLVIFAIGYGKSAAGQLGKEHQESVIFATQTPEMTEEHTVRVPLLIAGKVNDIRALSITLTYPSSSLKYGGVEKVGELDRDYCFLAAKADGNTVRVDAAVIGLHHAGLSREGIFAYVIFKELSKSASHAIGIQSAKARDSNNAEIAVTFEKSIEEVGATVPTTFALNQNYPNPFNPMTTIEYQLPQQVQVEISVYNIVGEKIAVLVNEEKNAGHYRIDWNGTDMLRQFVSSGVYFYRMHAGEFLDVKKLLLIR